MAIQTISSILINGSSSIFGGFIYSTKFSVSIGDAPSTVRISVISESGNYTIGPGDLQNTYCNLYTIKIGSQISFTGFLESYSQSVSSSGRTLELEFVDNSRVLDVIQVGLYKRFGLKSTKKMLLVGKEVDPCNPDGYVDPVKTFFDPCNPCVASEQQEAERNYVDCVEKRKYEILDVKYNFTELLQKIATIPIKIHGAVDINPKYLTQHTGSLRECLSSWAADFGFFWYWDKGEIYFKDLRSTIQVSADIESFCSSLVSYESNYSMKNSVKTATITNFTRPGDPAKFYDCQEAKYIECESLRQNVSYSMPLTVSPKIDSIAAGLAKYSDELRDLYYFYVNYQMYDAANFVLGKKLPKLGMTILSPQFKLGVLNGNGKNISNATVPAGLANLDPAKKSGDPFLAANNIGTGTLTVAQKANVVSIRANADFFECVQLLDIEHQWKIVDNPNNYFFFVAARNDTINNNFLQEEKDFASFLHKYAVYVPDSDDPFFEDYDFELDNLCGYQHFVDTGNVSYNFLGDGISTPTFYNTSSQGNGAGFGHIMGDLPFARFLSVIRDTRSSTSSVNTQIQFKLIVVERGGNPFVPDGGIQHDGEYDPIRTARLLEKAKQYLPHQIANKNNLRGELVARILNGANISNYSASDVFLYVGHVAGENDFRLTEINAFNGVASFGTLFDGKPLNKQENPELQTTEIIYQYPELKCSILGNHSFGGRTTLHANRVVFHTPISSFKYTEPTDALYGLVIEKTKKKRRIVKKIESFNSTNLEVPDSCDFAKLRVNSRNISDDRLSVLTKTNSVCHFDAQAIKTIHDEFAENLATNFTQPSISKTFKIAGTEIDGFAPTIDNGLINMDVSIDDNGIFTTYELGTRLMVLPNEESLVYGKSLNIMGRPGSYTNTTNNYPLVGQPNI